jgi:F420-dependent oxidoreductase-like protein
MAALMAGLSVPPTTDSRHDLDVIREIDAAGVQTAWQTAGGTRPDSMTLMAAAAVTTSSIRFGTSIVPTYPRHPTVLANQAKVIESLAPGRLRLGVGPSHRPTIEGRFGISMGKPLTHLREYVTVLRALLRDEDVDFHGEYLNVSLPSARSSVRLNTEVLVSALSENAFRLAGEISDGAISWVAPVPYLVNIALPAVQEGATNAGRPTPPIIAHVPVAVTSDRSRALKASAGMFGGYGALPFYAKMFAAAGVPVGSDKRTSPEAIDVLTVSGSPDTIRARLEAIVSEGIGELLISHVPVADEAAERSELSRILAG